MLYGLFENEKEAEQYFANTIVSCEKAVKHYDFVLAELNNDVSVVELEYSKIQLINYINTLRQKWVARCLDCQNKLLELKELKGEKV